MSRPIPPHQVHSKASGPEKMLEKVSNESEQNSLTNQRSDVETDESKQEEPKDKREIGGREGPDPTRYGDWEMNGRCIDF